MIEDKKDVKENRFDEIKKLCDLSRLEIDVNQIGEMANKITETIGLFDKLDDFKITLKEDYDEDMKSERPIDDLRDENHSLNSYKTVKSNYLDSNSSDDDIKENRKVTSVFLNLKNGYVIGPRI